MVKLQLIGSKEEYDCTFLEIGKKIEHDNLKLLIIDNISAICENFIKADFTVDFIERSQFLVKHSTQLKKLAAQHNMVIIVLNNVVSDVQNETANKGFFE